MEISLYRVTTSQAYRMSETGDHFSDKPSNYQDRNYTVDTPEHAERMLTLATGVEHFEGQFGDTVLQHPDGSTATLQEVLDPQGHVIDRKWGSTANA